MQIKPVNPQTWLNGFHINHAIEVSSGQRVLYCSGQTSNAADGAPMHPGDYVAQFKLAWKNVVELLTAANMKPSNIVRMKPLPCGHYPAEQAPQDVYRELYEFFKS